MIQESLDTRQGRKRMEPIPIAAGPAMFRPEFSLRSRREQPYKDVLNARRYEHWNTDAPGPTQNRPDVNRQAAYSDMNPINTRTVTRDYRQAQPFVAGAGKLGDNPYFQKYDVATDPRNVVRELQGAVYEYNPPRDQEVSQKLLSRNFETLHVPEAQVKKSYEEAIDVFAGIRPKLNDMKATFR
jgi:hypothetical protein